MANNIDFVYCILKPINHAWSMTDITDTDKNRFVSFVGLDDESTTLASS